MIYFGRFTALAGLKIMRQFVQIVFHLLFWSKYKILYTSPVP